MGGNLRRALGGPEDGSRPVVAPRGIGRAHQRPGPVSDPRGGFHDQGETARGLGVVGGGVEQDALAALGEPQHGEGLLVVGGLGVETAEDGGVGIAPEGGGEDPGEFALAVGDVGAGLDEGIDDVAEGEEGFVDVAPLAEGGAGGLGPAGALGAREVDEVENPGAFAEG